MDHYKTLGLRRDASKEEIKEAFRRLALRFHPDKHSQSSKEVRDGASARFKQASEAYEVLIDERKKSEYDLGFSSRRGASSSSSYYYGARQYGYGYGGGGSYRRPPQRDGGVGMDMEFLLRFVTRKGFLLNVAFASVLLGGAVFIERSLEELWRMNNSGKSFEEAMESIEKVKIQKENSQGS
ncbi:chaperone protein dnaJ 72 [Typha angustifolia]|uniref:chaperone protein dnaJ 72 n=1 Tax=Typha angustifolia TaxID=59011 RepID=UPI003C2BD3EB